MCSDLTAALERSVPRLCQGCNFLWPFTPAGYKSVGDGFMVEGYGEGDSHKYPRGGLVACDAQLARAALAAHKDCSCMEAKEETE